VEFLTHSRLTPGNKTNSRATGGKKKMKYAIWIKTAVNCKNGKTGYRWDRQGFCETPEAGHEWLVKYLAGPVKAPIFTGFKVEKM
jgi:hypothetical protein